MTDTAFNQDQFDALYPDGIGNHYWNHARNRIISSFLKRHHRYHDRILEIGCGRGVVLASLHAEGFDCQGVELGNARPYAGCNHIMHTRQDAFRLPLKLRKSINTILLLDVIEHMEKPEDFLNKIKHAFENARHLLITVPARQELWTNYDEYNRHFRRYDLKEIRKLGTGEFSLIKAQYFNHLLYPFFWIYTRGFKKRDTVIRAPSGICILVHRILSLVLQTDHHVLPSHWAGTSIIALFSLKT